MFATDNGYTDPALSHDPAQLRMIFTAFSEYLRSEHRLMTVTQASLDALAAHTRKRSDTVRTRIE